MIDKKKDLKLFFFPRSEQSAKSDQEQIEITSSLDHIELKKIKESAYRDGFEQGINEGKMKGHQEGSLLGNKEGFQQGYISGEKQFRQDFKSVSNVLDIFKKNIEELNISQNLNHKEELCELVYNVSQKVIRAELALNPQQILHLIEETIESLPNKEKEITILLNKNDLDRIKKSNINLKGPWKLESDDSIDEGDCKIVTEDTEADASCKTRLDECMKSVKKHITNGE